MTNIKTTQLHGMEKQILEWINVIEGMEGYEETDLNPLYETVSYLVNARNEIFYAIEEAKNE